MSEEGKTSEQLEAEKQQALFDQDAFLNLDSDNEDSHTPKSNANDSSENQNRQLEKANNTLEKRQDKGTQKGTDPEKPTKSLDEKSSSDLSENDVETAEEKTPDSIIDDVIGDSNLSKDKTVEDEDKTTDDEESDMEISEGADPSRELRSTTDGNCSDSSASRRSEKSQGTDEESNIEDNDDLNALLAQVRASIKTPAPEPRSLHVAEETTPPSPPNFNADIISVLGIPAEKPKDPKSRPTLTKNQKKRNKRRKQKAKAKKNQKKAQTPSPATRAPALAQSQEKESSAKTLPLNESFRGSMDMEIDNGDDVAPSNIVLQKSGREAISRSAERVNTYAPSTLRSSRNGPPAGEPYDPIRPTPRGYNYNESQRVYNPNAAPYSDYRPSYEPRRRGRYNSPYYQDDYRFRDSYYAEPNRTYGNVPYYQQNNQSYESYNARHAYQRYPPSDPALVINMNEVSDDSDSDSQVNTPRSHDTGQQRKKTPEKRYNPSHKGPNVPTLAARSIEQDLQQKRAEIERLQRIIAETEKKKQSDKPVSSSNILQKRKRTETESTSFSSSPSTPKRLKIDIDCTKVSDLTKRVKEREALVVAKKQELRKLHDESELLLESISDYEAKADMCSHRVTVLQEKLRVLQQQLDESEKNKKLASGKLNALQVRLQTLEQEYKEQRNFLEQEKIVLCEMEVEEKFFADSPQRTVLSPLTAKTTPSPSPSTSRLSESSTRGSRGPPQRDVPVSNNSSEIPSITRPSATTPALTRPSPFPSSSSHLNTPSNSTPSHTSSLGLSHSTPHGSSPILPKTTRQLSIAKRGRPSASRVSRSSPSQATTKLSSTPVTILSPASPSISTDSPSPSQDRRTSTATPKTVSQSKLPHEAIPMEVDHTTKTASTISSESGKTSSIPTMISLSPEIAPKPSSSPSSQSITSTQAPNSTPTAIPAPTTSQPSKLTSKVTKSMSTASTFKPTASVSTSKPIASTSKPTASTSKPTASTSKPTASISKSTASTSKPAKPKVAAKDKGKLVERMIDEVKQKHRETLRLLDQQAEAALSRSRVRPAASPPQNVTIRLTPTSFHHFDKVNDFLESNKSCFSDLPTLTSSCEEEMERELSSLPAAASKEEMSRSPVQEEYRSPLMCFRSYRLSPHFRVHGESITGAGLMYDIDPSNVLCRFEVHGTCNDDECPWAHFRDMTRSANEIIDLCAQYARLRTSKQELSPQIESLLQLLRAQIGKVPTESLISNFVQQINSLQTDHHYIPLISAPASPRPKLSSNQVSHSSINLLGIGKSTSKRTKQLARVSMIEFDEPLNNLLEQDVIPLYDLPSEETTKNNDSTLEKRYYKLSDENYEMFIKNEPQNISLWIHFALSKLSSTTPQPSGTRGYYDALCVLVKALESNPTSVELWRLYLEFFGRSGTAENFVAVLSKATNYVPFSYSVWYLRWTCMATVEQKLDTLNAAIHQYLQYSPATSPILLSSSALSEAVLLFILAASHVLCEAGHAEFAKKRLLRLLASKYTGDVQPTNFPFQSANQFLPEGQLKLLWTVLQAKELSVLTLQVAHLFVFDRLACTHASFARRMNPFSISWERAKQIIQDKESLSQRINEVCQLFEQVLPLTEGTAMPKEEIPIAISYISLLESLCSIESARDSCKKIIKNSPKVIEFWQLYAGLESRVDPAVGELIYKKSLLQFRDSKSLWFAFASFFVSRKQTTQAINALLSSVSLREFQGDTTPSAKKIAKGHNQFRDRIESSEKEDVFLWLNYCLFLSLINKSPQKIFERSLLYTFRRENRKLLFLEYLRWQISQNFSRAKILDTLDRIFNHFGSDINSPLRDETSADLLRHKYIYDHFVTPSAEDFSYLDQLVGMVIDSIHDMEGKELVLNLYLQRFPRNFYLHYKLGKLRESQNKLNKARKGYTSAIKLCSNFAPAWKRLIVLETKNNPTEVAPLLLSALTHLPENKWLCEKQAMIGKESNNVIELD